MSVFPVSLPAFGEKDYADTWINASARVILLPQADESRFSSYCAALQQAGFAPKEQRNEEYLSFAAYEKDGWGKLKNGSGWICLDFAKKIEKK